MGARVLCQSGDPRGPIPALLRTCSKGPTRKLDGGYFKICFYGFPRMALLHSRQHCGFTAFQTLTEGPFAYDFVNISA